MCMYFSIDINKHCGLPVIYLGNCVCQFVKEVKYLGVMIHSSMKTTIDVARQTRKFYMQANLLLRNFMYCSDDVKCTLFQSYCTNMYCCQLWFSCTKRGLIKLSTSYNSVLRRLLCISKPYSRGAKQGGLGGLNPPWILDGGGVEHLSTPHDFEKKIFRGGWLPLNWSNYIVYVFLST